MATEPKTVVHGTLEEDGDTWFVIGEGEMILVDAPFLVDASLEHKTVGNDVMKQAPPAHVRAAINSCCA
jgi:hypothetical protein